MDVIWFDHFSTVSGRKGLSFAFDYSLEDAITDSQGERDVKIVLRRKGLEPAKPAAEIISECLLDFTGSETRPDVGR